MLLELVSQVDQEVVACGQEVAALHQTLKLMVVLVVMLDLLNKVQVLLVALEIQVDLQLELVQVIKEI